tara:strand:- start:400 stop:819 length:420 start_codon:yes stop_codon:yes gene_type:complete
MDNSLTILVNETQQKPIKYKIEMEETSRFIIAEIFFLFSLVFNIIFIITRNNLVILQIVWYILYIMFNIAHYLITYKEDNIVYIKDNLILTILCGISLLFQFIVLTLYEDNIINLFALIVPSIYNIMYIFGYYYNLYYK